MAKRKEQPPEEGSPAWMSTFSDLMNLLMCFFVLLFASSTMDAEKIQKIAASFNDISFSILESGSVSLDEGAIVSGGVTQLPGIESFLEYIGVSSEVKGNNQDLSATGADDGESDKQEEVSESMEDVESENSTFEQASLSKEELKEQVEAEGLKQSEEMYDEVSELVETYKIDDRVVMDYNSQYVSLDLNGAVLFDAGKAEIREDALIYMQKIASILSRYKDCVIEIEGHTDNVPIHNSQFESNLYLSTARASKVYEFILEETTLNKENLKVAGYGDTHPVASNETEEGRAKNRRVSIKIYNSLNSTVDTGQQTDDSSNEQ